METVKIQPKLFCLGCSQPIQVIQQLCLSQLFLFFHPPSLIQKNKVKGKKEIKERKIPWHIFLKFSTEQEKGFSEQLNAEHDR